MPLPFLCCCAYAHPHSPSLPCSIAGALLLVPAATCACPHSPAGPPIHSLLLCCHCMTVTSPLIQSLLLMLVLPLPLLLPLHQPLHDHPHLFTHLLSPLFDCCCWCCSCCCCHCLFMCIRPVLAPSSVCGTSQSTSVKQKLAFNIVYKHSPFVWK
jgi:hypothetical protein